MQTFLPYPDIVKSLECLDNKRLGKQRVETFQIISAITGRKKKDGGEYKGWVSHPCTIMWKNNLSYLKLYYNASIDEWVNRGFKNNMLKEDINEEITVPLWFGNKSFHDSHKSNLLRKDKIFYSKYDWNVNPNNSYLWMDENNKWYIKTSQDKFKIYVTK